MKQIPLTYVQSWYYMNFESFLKLKFNNLNKKPKKLAVL